MRLDSANRAFVALVGFAFVAYAFIGMAACALLGVLGYRLVAGGWAGYELGLLAAAVFLGSIGAGAVFGVVSAGRQVRATRRLGHRIAARRAPLPEPLLAAAEAVELSDRVELVDDVEVYSFAYGLFVPRVVVSRGMLDRCEPDELETVLEHERYHVRNLDPLKVVVARTLPAWLYFVPALRGLERRYVAGRELAADRRAVRRHGTRALAAVLYKVVRGPDWPEMATAAAIGGSDLLEARVVQLESGNEPPLPTADRRSLLVSLVGVAALTAVFVAALVSAGPLVGPRVGMRMSGGMSGVSVVGAVACVAFWGVVGFALFRLTRQRRQGIGAMRSS